MGFGILKLRRNLLIVQQILHSICGIKTSLSTGTAFEIYNSTRSKAQITLMNRINQSISYDTLHRLLTSAYNSIISTIEDKGIYIPPNMRHGVFTQYSMDNIDWSEKTADGSTYATSSIMIQTPMKDTNEETGNTKSIQTLPNIKAKHLSREKKNLKYSISAKIYIRINQHVNNTIH